MRHLGELLEIDLKAERQEKLKKAFMLYTEPLAIDGEEEKALTILLNLSLSKPKCKDYLDAKRAEQYYAYQDYLHKALGEIKWFHSHNLKYPDSRVKGQRLLLRTEDKFSPLGWAHNSGTYPHTIWLLNTFMWQHEETCILREIERESSFWIDLLRQFGLKEKQISELKSTILQELSSNEFPNSVSPYSTQVRFPYDGEYISITPVVSHARQQALERTTRCQESKLRTTTLTLPHPAAIGNLIGSLGGNVRALYYPAGVSSRATSTLLASKKHSQKYFDDYQLTNKAMCSVLGRLCGRQTMISKEGRAIAKKSQLKKLRKQIALWLLPLIELKEKYSEEETSSLIEDELASRFIAAELSELPRLAKELNHRLHYAFQNNKFARKYAYHQKLLQPVRAQLEWVLNTLALPDAIEGTQDQTEQFIYLSSLRVDAAQAQSSPYLVGLPSLSAVWGFMHRYQLNFERLVKSGEEFDFSGFALFVRNEYIYRSAKLSEPNDVAKKRTVSQAKRPITRSNIYTNLEIDLVIRVKTTESLTDHLKLLKAALPTGFAGGMVFPPELDLKIDWFQVFNSRSSLYFSLKGLDRSGTWVSPMEESLSSLSELETTLSNDHDTVAVSCGYQLLERPIEREGSLLTNHAYADNVLGVAKKVNPIEYRMSGSDHFFSTAFWSLHQVSESILIKMDKSE